MKTFFKKLKYICLISFWLYLVFIIFTSFLLFISHPIGNYNLCNPMIKYKWQYVLYPSLKLICTLTEEVGNNE